MRAYEQETEFAPELGEYGEAEYEEGEDEYGEAEYEGEYGEYEYGEGEYGEDELGEEEFEEEMEQFLAELQELSGEYGSPLSEEEEMDLAAELLELSTEDELGSFLGKIIAKVGSRVGPKVIKAGASFLKNRLKKAPSVARSVGRKVRTRHRARARRRHDVARAEQLALDARQRPTRRTHLLAQRSAERLPPKERDKLRMRMDRAARRRGVEQRRRLEHPALGAARSAAPWFGWGGAAGLGTGVGATALYNHAPQIWDFVQGLWPGEFEGMEPEEAEFEAARRFVRLSAAAARNLASARRHARPQAAARAALLAAARRYAPGMYQRFPLYVAPA